MSNRAKRAQDLAIDQKLADMVVWYAANSAGGQPTICVDVKSYRGKVLRWLEPLLPGLENPVLIEETLGDDWTLRMEPITPKIQIFTK